MPYSKTVGQFGTIQLVLCRMSHKRQSRAEQLELKVVSKCTLSTQTQVQSQLKL